MDPSYLVSAIQPGAGVWGYNLGKLWAPWYHLNTFCDHSVPIFFLRLLLILHVIKHLPGVPNKVTRDCKYHNRH